MEENLRVIQYLGSKLKILDSIDKEIGLITNEGELVVDLFAGTGVVAAYLAGKYRVAANDVQEYSSLITGVLIKNLRTNLTYKQLTETDAYKSNKNKLSELFHDILEYENNILEVNDYKALAEMCESNVFYNGKNINPKSRKKLKKIFGDSLEMFSDKKVELFRKDKTFYALFTLYYSNSYFSVAQCIEIDSIRKAIDSISEGGVLESSEKQVLLVCLLHAISEVVSSVGKNFAQPIKVIDVKGNIKNFAIKRCMRDRKLKIEDSFSEMLEILNRERNIFFKNNIVYCKDAIDVFVEPEIKSAQTFYLDPPYTIDHYSRFYHILETAVKYDYPELEEKNYSEKCI